MAKKKKRKEPEQPKEYQIELKGLLVILVSIIGLCKFGVVGNILKCFAVFLVGEWYAVFYIFTIIIGLYMMIKRELPKFLTSKLIGLYIFCLAGLLLSHLTPYANFKGFDTITETFNNICSFVKDPNVNIAGGGLIGGCLDALFVWLLDANGTRICCYFLLVAGVIMFTGLSILDVINFLKDKAKNAKEKLSAHEKAHIKKVENEYDEDVKVVTSEDVKEVEVKPEVEADEQISFDAKTGEIKDPEDNSEEDSKVYFFPPSSLLNKPAKVSNKENEQLIETNIPILVEVLKDFGIESKVVDYHVGPAVTQYELGIKTGTKVSKILAVNREIALALSAKEVRIQAPIPGKNTIGIEIPNKKNSMVGFREVIEKIPSSLEKSKLAVTLGKDIMGNVQYCEINKTPHLLVAGSTGSGKSVCINSFIVSILMRAKPDEVKLVLVDPKKVELSMYNGVPHLLAPVVTDARRANIALKKMVVEMERRYEMFEDSGTKNIAGYNSYVEKINESLPEGEKKHKMPYIVIIIDELADLMLVAAKEVQDSIMRITQMARAAGMHLIVATQRPSTDVITGVVKANIPSRIAFAVQSGIDSRTILDSVGAEKLLGKGDMLFLPQGENTPIRIQGTFISDDEIKAVVDFTIKQQKAKYDETLIMDDEEMGATSMVGSSSNEGNDYDSNEDPLYNQVLDFAYSNKKISTSLVQRRFKIGYNRAANIIDKLEEHGIVGPQNGSKPREVIMPEGKTEE